MDQDKYPAPVHSTLEVRHDQARPDPESIFQHNVNSGGNWDRPDERRIWGLRPTTFWLSFALLTVIILAVVGGAVGGALASHKSTQPAIISPIPSTSKSSSSSRTPRTSTSTSTPTSSPTSSSIPSNDCPSSNNTIFTAPLTSSGFLITCGIDWTTNETAADGSGNVKDIVGIFADSMENCIDACASYNYNQGSTLCRAVSYTADLSQYWVEDQHANCFLKNKPGVNKVVDAITVAALVS